MHGNKKKKKIKYLKSLIFLPHLKSSHFVTLDFPGTSERTRYLLAVPGNWLNTSFHPNFRQATVSKGVKPYSPVQAYGRFREIARLL